MADVLPDGCACKPSASLANTEGSRLRHVDGWEGGFLYPKVQVEKSVEAVVLAAEATQELCSPHGIEILNIDADTSPDVESSQFVTLYQN